jgi:hypothetical protein
MDSSIEMIYTKEMLLNAFQQNKRKRNFMLYKVYESWFSYDLTAETIASLITQDLGFPISKSIVDMTRIRVMKKQMNLSENTLNTISAIPLESRVNDTKKSELFVAPAETILEDFVKENKPWEFDPKPLPKITKTMEQPSTKPKNILDF